MLRTLLRVLKWIGFALGAAILVLAVHVYRTWDRTWDAPLPDLHASTDPATIARGEYLVFGPAHCVECHVGSMEEYLKYGETGTRPGLIGGFAFPAPPLGVIYSKNITPDVETGIGRATDPQIARMLRHSVRPDGKASIQPMMPFGDMSDEDVVAILSFLRSQPPVRHVVPEAEWTLTGKIIKSLAGTFKPRLNVHPPAMSPPQAPTKERGAYLARSVSDCATCHSPLNELTFEINGPEFSGGIPFEPSPVPGVDKTLWFKPPNITPLPGSALMKFPDRATFMARFLRGGRQYAGSPMPWECFARMTPEDVGALYEFLHSVPAAGEPSPKEPTVPH